jgi:maintenance of mitochondrial morphology protein 1
MPSTSLWSLQPTFLQGFVVGQISILLLLALILKYLFFESAPPGSPTVLAPLPAPRFQQRDAQSATPDAEKTLASVDATDPVDSRVAGIESVEWFNLIIREVRSGGVPSGR